MTARERDAMASESTEYYFTWEFILKRQWEKLSLTAISWREQTYHMLRREISERKLISRVS
jgi:hypothetical protein